MKRTLRTPYAGVAAYVALVACGAVQGHETMGLAHADEGADTEYEAGPAALVETAEVFCDKTIGEFRYAEKEYPGSTGFELASQVIAVVRLTDAHDVPPAPSGYTQQVFSLAWVRDGAVTAICGSANTPTFPYVTFIKKPRH